MVMMIMKVEMIKCDKGKFLVILKSFARIYEEINERLQFLVLLISELSFYAFICMVNTAKKWVIVVAAGKGARFGSELPKQFVLLNGKPVISYSLEVFSQLDFGIIVVIHPDYVHHLKSISGMYGFPEHQVVFGGSERFHSVQNALLVIPDSAEWVMVHDAARPNIDTAFVEMLIGETVRYGNAIPALPLIDSLRMRQGEGWVSVLRDDFRVIQTPQCFAAADLKIAYEQPYRNAFTDDASVLESAGKTIHVVPGKVGNIKITHADDLHWMSYLMDTNNVEKN